MIIGLVGNLGRGKTLGMTMLGHYFKYNTRLNNVVSNYETDITTHYVTNANELENMSQEIEGIYLLDEIWAWMSSREAMENDEMIDLVLNSRKRGCLIIYTVQDLKMADNILTDITDYYGICSHYESHEIDADNDIGEIQLINSNGKPVRCFSYNAETYYGTYDTSEEITSQTDAQKYKEIVEEVTEAVACESFDSSITGDREKGFNTKKEAIGFLELHTDLSHTKKEAVVEEAFRKAENYTKSSKKQNKDSKGGENGERIQNESLKRYVEDN